MGGDLLLISRALFRLLSRRLLGDESLLMDSLFLDVLLYRGWLYQGWLCGCWIRLLRDELLLVSSLPSRCLPRFGLVRGSCLRLVVGCVLLSLPLRDDASLLGGSFGGGSLCGLLLNDEFSLKLRIGGLLRCCLLRRLLVRCLLDDRPPNLPSGRVGALGRPRIGVRFGHVRLRRRL